MNASVRSCYCGTARFCHGSLRSLEAWRPKPDTPNLRLRARSPIQRMTVDSSSNMHIQSQQLLSVAPMYVGRSSIKSCAKHAAVCICKCQRLVARLCRMDWTDLHFRQLCRMISKHTWLYTEMIVDQTLIHNQEPDRYITS